MPKPLAICCLFALLVTLQSSEFYSNPKPAHQSGKSTLSQTSPNQPASNYQDESDKIYSNFIDNLLENQQFFTSLLQSVSDVFYNHWLQNIPTELQKKYLKILLTTVQNDQENTPMTPQDYFDILKQLLQQPKIAKQFLHYLKFDFAKPQFQQFIVKHYPEQAKTNFKDLSDKDKASVYLLALKKEEELQIKPSPSGQVNTETKPTQTQTQTTEI